VYVLAHSPLLAEPLPDPAELAGPAGGTPAGAAPAGTAPPETAAAGEAGRDGMGSASDGRLAH
jgi:hypothetical protein